MLRTVDDLNDANDARLNKVDVFMGLDVGNR
jgi:hypothetical protein